MAAVWDPRKLESNIGKHGVGFAEAAIVLEDPMAITVVDTNRTLWSSVLSLLEPMPRAEFWWWSIPGAATTSG